MRLTRLAAICVLSTSAVMAGADAPTSVAEPAPPDALGVDRLELESDADTPLLSPLDPSAQVTPAVPDAPPTTLPDPAAGESATPSPASGPKPPPGLAPYDPPRPPPPVFPPRKVVKPKPPQPKPPLSLKRNKQDTRYYYARGQALLAIEAKRRQHPEGKARNIILFVGDGMGVSTLTAARIYAGQRRGRDGESHALAMDTLPYAALAKTYSVNQQTADSAPTMTALMTGSKTKEGFVSVAGDIRKNAPDGCAARHHLATVAELAAAAGMATGVVSTARLTHATPAAVYGHTPNREAETDVDLKAQVARGALAETGCTDLAAQFVAASTGLHLRVALGGGRQGFLPSTVTDAEGTPGRRGDGRDLVAEWLKQEPEKSAVVQSRAELEAVDTQQVTRLLGLFNASHMDYEADRRDDASPQGEPSLAEMTEKAIKVLAKQPGGYLLVVEGGRIDHAHHAGNAYRALREAVALDEAVKRAMTLTREDDTLLLVTADHSHTLSLAGYPHRNNPILGLVYGTDDLTGEPRREPSVDAQGKPYTTLGYANGPGAQAGPRADLKDEVVADPDHLQDARVPLGSETHGGEDVMVLARGPGAHLVRGVIEQSYLFHVMVAAVAKLQALVTQP